MKKYPVFIYRDRDGHYVGEFVYGYTDDQISKDRFHDKYQHYDYFDQLCKNSLKNMKMDNIYRTCEIEYIDKITLFLRKILFGGISIIKPLTLNKYYKHCDHTKDLYPKNCKLYKILKGEDLYTISTRYWNTARELAIFNKIFNNRSLKYLARGEYIHIPFYVPINKYTVNDNEVIIAIDSIKRLDEICLFENRLYHIDEINMCFRYLGNGRFIRITYPELYC